VLSVQGDYFIIL